MSTAPPPPSGEDPPPPDVTADHATADHDAPAEGARPPRRRLTVLAVAAAVLLAGGGGAYWTSTSGSDSDPAAGGAPPKLALDDFGPWEDAASVSQRSSVERPEYRAVGELPRDEPKDAPLYRLSGPLEEDAVQELTDALDVSGPLRTEDGGWRTSGTAGGDGPFFKVSDNRSHPWVYSDRDGSHRERVNGEWQATSPPVSEEEAKRAAKPLLEKLGLSDASLDAHRAKGAERLVWANPQYQGLTVEGWPTVVTVGPEGEVEQVSGNLLTAEEGPRYPILSAEETLAELNDKGNRFDVPPCAEQLPVAPHDAREAQADGVAPANPGSDDAVTSDQGSAQDTPSAPDATDEPPRLLPCERSGTVRVTDAELGLAHHVSNGKPVLVPSWLYTVKAGHDGAERTVTYPAVAPEYLAPRQASSDVDRSTPPENPESPDNSESPGSGEGTQPDEDPERKDPDTGSLRVNQYSGEDRTLTLYFWGGVCHAFSGVVEESDDQVRVSVESRPKNDEKTYCVAIAKKHSVTVKLDQPIGERTVVDDEGEPLPKRK